MPRSNTPTRRPTQEPKEARLDEAALVAANVSRLRIVLERNMRTTSEPDLILRLKASSRSPVDGAVMSKGRHYNVVMPVLELLAERWPNAFSIFENRRQPLRVGIHTEILRHLDGVVTPADLSLALKIYVSNRVYRSRLVAGATRIGLDGEAAGVVTEKEAATPAKVQPAKTTVPITPDSTISAPKRRLSLADLRAAAHARKAGVTS